MSLNRSVGKSAARKEVRSQATFAKEEVLKW